MGKVSLRKVNKVPIWRKMAMGSWRTAKDPSVYGQIDLDLQPVLDLLPKYNEKHGVRITPGHLVGRAIAICMKERPEINGMIRGSRIYLREHVSLFYQVNVPGEGKNKVKDANLAGTVIHKAEDLSAAGIAKALNEKALKVRKREDKELERGFNLFKMVPWPLMGIYLDFVSWLIYGLNLNLSFLKIPSDPFGSVMITNVGSLGIDIAWAPLVPHTRVPLLVALGAIQKKPIVVDDKIEIRPVMSVGVTFDHRMIDGVHAAQMARKFKKMFSHPEEVLLAD